MRERLSKFLKKLSLISASAASVVTLMTGGFAGFISIAQPAPVAAQTATSGCAQDDFPETNIIYCGLTGSDSYHMEQSFQNYYTAGSDAHSGNPITHTDLKAAYTAMYYAVNRNNNIGDIFKSGTWAVGTAYDTSASPIKGHTTIVVDGNVVAMDLHISSRCPSLRPQDGYCQPVSAYPALTDSNGNAVTNIHTRDANWFFMKDKNGNLIHSEVTLVHLGSNKVADFALWFMCGNGLTFTPVIPKQTLVCKQLDYKLDSQDDNSFVYSFVVAATVQNVSNITYKIDYGDGHTESKSVSNGQATMNFGPHSYTRLENDKVYTIKAIVNNQPQVAACQKNITVTGKSKLTFACSALTPDLDASSTSTQQIYNFVGKVQGTDTAVSYKFTFTNTDGSQSTQNVSPDAKNPQQSNPIQYKYNIDTTKVQTFSASFVATSKTGLVTEAVAPCAFTKTTSLPSTGPEGTLGIFAGTSVLGVGLHQFVLRRKAKALL